METKENFNGGHFGIRCMNPERKDKLERLLDEQTQDCKESYNRVI